MWKKLSESVPDVLEQICHHLNGSKETFLVSPDNWGQKAGCIEVNILPAPLQSFYFCEESQTCFPELFSSC